MVSNPVSNPPMNRFLKFCFISISIFLCFSQGVAQNKADSLTDEMKSRMYNTFRHFTFGFYVDAYINLPIDGIQDSSNVIPFSSNCPVIEQIRLNVAAIEMYYNSDIVRGKLVLQWGDAPNLLAAPDAQFIKTLRQANFGFRIYKDLWVDFGYLFNPLGYESSWGVLNQISTVSVGGYFSYGNVLGIKLSYKFNDKFSGGIMAGDPYTLAHEQNSRIAGIIFLNYKPIPALSLSYNNFFGNGALRTSSISMYTLYNNIIVTYDPTKQIGLVGQFDFAFQSNSALPPNTTKSAGLYSGFLQARYTFLKHFAVTTRYEFFNDPNAILSDIYTFNGETRGLLTNGFALELEYKPVKIGYFRLGYKFLHANRGNNVFYSNISDHMNAVIFTTGVRF
jgi:hypothetical protein